MGTKILRFSANNSLYLGNVARQHDSNLLWNANRNLYGIYQMVPFPMNDP